MPSTQLRTKNVSNILETYPFTSQQNLSFEALQQTFLGRFPAEPKCFFLWLNLEDHPMTDVRM